MQKKREKKIPTSYQEWETGRGRGAGGAAAENPILSNQQMLDVTLKGSSEQRISLEVISGSLTEESRAPLPQILHQQDTTVTLRSPCSHPAVTC